MSNLLVSPRRIFMAIPAWNISAPTIIGEIEQVVERAVNHVDFKNGIESIKELSGTKFVRVSKKEIESLLSYNEEDIKLYKQLIKRY